MQAKLILLCCFGFGSIVTGSSKRVGFKAFNIHVTYDEASRQCAAKRLKLAVIRNKANLEEAASQCGSVGGSSCWTSAIGSNGHIKYGAPGICVAIRSKSYTWLNIKDCTQDRLPFICQPDIKCRVPNSPNRRQVDDACREEMVPGRRAYFECDEGYEMIGKNSVECGEDGQWKWSLPTCQRSRTKKIEVCPPLGGLRNAAVTYTKGNLFGSKVTIACGPNSRLLGNRELRCQSGGRWSSATPRCIGGQCSKPVLTNGQVQVSNGQRLGSIATFSCDSGYVRKGTSQSTCRENGVWTPDKPVCVVPRCPALTQPLNGNLVHTGAYAVGSEARYQCYNGFDMDGSQVVRCREDTTWSAPPPTCYKCQTGVSSLDVCQNPAIGDKIQLKCTGHSCDFNLENKDVSFAIVSESYQGTLHGPQKVFNLHTALEKQAKKWTYTLSLEVERTTTGTYTCGMGDSKKEVFLQPIEAKWWGRLICKHDSLIAKSNSVPPIYLRVNRRELPVGEGGRVSLPGDLRGQVTQADVCFCDKRFSPQGCVKAECSRE